MRVIDNRQKEEQEHFGTVVRWAGDWYFILDCDAFPKPFGKMYVARIRDGVVKQVSTDTACEYAPDAEIIIED